MEMKATPLDQPLHNDAIVDIVVRSLTLERVLASIVRIHVIYRDLFESKHLLEFLFTA
jgi:hypothetical protein